MSELAIQIGETISFILILLSFAILTSLAFKAKSIRSLQFQLFLFALILVISEVPLMLESLGFLSLEPIKTTWLSSTYYIYGYTFWIHTLSHIPILKEMKKMSKEKNFETIFLEAIEEALISVFGKEAYKAVNFYVDPHIAVNDPDNYANKLEKMFLDGAKVIIDRIIDTLCKFM